MINTDPIREELGKVKDSNKTLHDSDGAGKSPIVPPKVYKISLFGRKSDKNSENNVAHVDAAEKMGSNQAIEESESGNKFDNSTANVSFIQNLKETATSIESVAKDKHASKEAVDTTLDHNNKSDNKDLQEVSLVFHPREPVMTAFCDDSVFRKSAQNNNNRVKNTGTETLSKTCFEGSENESSSRNLEKARSKSIEQVQNCQESKIGSNCKNSGKAKSKSSDQVQRPESIKTDPRTVSKASVYEALFKKCVISEGIKTYGSDFTSKHPELLETHVKQEPGLSECIIIKQEPNTKANDDETSSTILSNDTDQFTNSYEELLYKRDNFDSTYRGDLNSNRMKRMRKRKVNDDTTLGQRTKKLKQSKVKIPKRLSVKNVPGNALFANFNEPTEVYTKPVSRKSSETVGLDVPMSTDAFKDLADIKKEPMEHCNGSLPKAARGRGRPRKTAGKQYQSQVSSLSETVELKRSAKLNYSSSKRMVDKVKVEPMDANDRYEVQKKVSDEVTETKEVFGDGDKASNYKFNGSKKTCKKKSMKRGDIDLDDSGKAGLNASEKSCVKTVKSGGKRANSKYIKEAIASGSLLICEECGKWFAFRSHLKNHLLLHSKELPYKCLVCLKRFRLRYQIQQHTRRMHPEVELHNKDLDMNDDSEISSVKEEYED